MRHFCSFLSLITAAILLASCAEIVVKKVDYAESRMVPEDASPAPVRFSKLRFLLPPGTEIGLESGMGPALLGGFCSWTNYPVSRRVLKGMTEVEYVKESFATALEANGYDVVESIDMDYRPEDEEQRAEYSVSARVKDVDIDLCKRDRVTSFNVFNTAPGAKGKIYARIDWTVYDVLRRAVVYETSTEGYSRRDYPNSEGLELLFMDAFEMAAHNLASDDGFYNLIVSGEKPPQDWRKGSPHSREREAPSRFDAREAVNILNPPLSQQPVPKHIDEIRDAGVMIQKIGHGSGVFITEEGHILTNQHVVGDAQQMRVVTRGKKHKLIAEVLRVDKVRDVALLKLTEIPAGLDIKPLPVRTAKLGVSEDVYALGVPVSYAGLQDTVTKGIVSAHRLRKQEGVRMPFIQADVEIHQGSSGGPLLDEYGNLVGISVSGYGEQGTDSMIGLNFFIPIAEALDALDITLDSQKTFAYSAAPDEKDEDSPDEAEETPIPLE